jgi:nucleoside-diphosphate-sugar epimerase
MRVLVTGGTGYLGSAIVRALLRAGHVPVVFSRHRVPVPQGLDAVRGDLRNAQDVHAAVRGHDAVCHAGALVSIWRRRPEDFDDVNVTGTANVIAACGALDIERLVYTSSFLALPPQGADDPLRANDYQRTKVEALRRIRAAAAGGGRIVTLVPGVIYGPGPPTEGNLVGRLIDDHLRGRLPGIVGGSRIWSLAWVDDVADAHVAALRHGACGAEYGLGGENVPQMRIFEILRDRLGRQLPRRLPSRLVRVVGALEEGRARVTGRSPLVTRGAVDIFDHDWPIDSTSSTALLGYSVRPLSSMLSGLLAEGGWR